MKEFIRDDGQRLAVIGGFRERFRYYGESVNPKAGWSDADYAAAVDKKIRKHQNRLEKFAKRGGKLQGARILEVGCGAGIDTLLMGLQPVEQVIGIDMHLRLFAQGAQGERTRRLVATLFERLGLGRDIDSVLATLPVKFESVDVLDLPYPDAHFDLLMSRSALEHFKPIDKALAEMACVVSPGGLMFHAIDPYYWYRGCHRGALVDIPWAHARLSMDEYRRFVTAYEGKNKAQRRYSQLQELNRFTLAQWREVIDAGPFEILNWKQTRSEVAETLLQEYPEVLVSRLEGVAQQDLVYNRIAVWLRNQQ